MDVAEVKNAEIAPRKKPNSSSRASSVIKKIDPETAKLIQQYKDKANKKPFGRKVRDAEIIALAIRQLSLVHVKELQEATLSERDRLQILHDEYQNSNGRISLDQFIGKLIRGEIKAGS